MPQVAGEQKFISAPALPRFRAGRKRSAFGDDYLSTEHLLLAMALHRVPPAKFSQSGCSKAKLKHISKRREAAPISESEGKFKRKILLI